MDQFFDQREVRDITAEALGIARRLPRLRKNGVLVSIPPLVAHEIVREETQKEAREEARARSRAKRKTTGRYMAARNEARQMMLVRRELLAKLYALRRGVEQLISDLEG